MGRQSDTVIGKAMKYAGTCIDAEIRGSGRCVKLGSGSSR